MKKKLFSLLALSLILVSCGNKNESLTTSESLDSEPITTESNSDKTTSTTSEEVKQFTVTWKNYDGSILEIDENVVINTMPTYDGDTPLRAKDETNTYIFNGWDPKLTPVIADITYTATFKAMPISEIKEGQDPILSQDGKTIKYGVYPQTHVNDEKLIANLNKLEISNEVGYFEYEGSFYAKQIAKTYNNEAYTFKDNTQIVNGETYWFKVEVITWNILTNDNGTYYLLANDLLDEGIYYQNLETRTIDNKTIYPNDYLHSDIKKLLNNDFKTKAFVNNTYIKDNDVFLPSLSDYLNTDYGFSSDESILDEAKKAKVSDYALCRGAWQNSKDASSIGCGTYWTSTASSETTYTAYNINSGGFISEYAVDGNGHCIRPAIKISL